MSLIQHGGWCREGEAQIGNSRLMGASCNSPSVANDAVSIHIKEVENEQPFR